MLGWRVNKQNHRSVAKELCVLMLIYRMETSESSHVSAGAQAPLGTFHALQWDIVWRVLVTSSFLLLIA